MLGKKVVNYVIDTEDYRPEWPQIDPKESLVPVQHSLRFNYDSSYLVWECDHGHLTVQIVMKREERRIGVLKTVILNTSRRWAQGCMNRF